MRKSLCCFMVLLLCCFVSTAIAQEKPEAFKPKAHQEVRKEIGAFFQRNKGNVITIDVMDGFMLHINQIFEGNAIFPEKKAAKPGPEKIKEIPKGGPPK